MAKISVIVLAFQQEAWIAECIESVLAQRTRHELEILIGEDHSTDGTYAVCERYARMDPRIRLLRRPAERKWRIDGHPTGRRNLMALLAAADGELVTLIDGDDGWLDPTKLERQADAILNDPTCAGTYHYTLIKDVDGTLQGRWGPELPDRIGPREAIVPRSPFHTSSFLWRNTPTLKAALTSREGWVAGSYDMFLFAAASLEGPLLRVEGDASFYRKHPSGISSTGLFKNSNILRLRILQWQRFDRRTHGTYRAHIDALCDEHLRLVRTSTINARDARRWVTAWLSALRYFTRSKWRTQAVKTILRRGMRGQ